VVPRQHGGRGHAHDAGLTVSLVYR
jgi:hypothetical protein